MSFAQKKTSTAPATGTRPYHWLQVILAGGFFSLAFAPLSWRWAVVPALFLLLHALRGRSPKTGARLGFLFGLAAYVISLSWLWNLFGALSLCLIAILALFPLAFGWLHAVVVRRTAHPWGQSTAIAASWLACEYLRAEHFWLEFTWVTPGLAVGPNPLLPWIGVYGVSFLVVAGVARLLHAEGWFHGAFLLFFLGAGAYNWQEGQSPVSPKDPVRVMLVQDESSDFDRYLAASAKAPADTQLVVWPEQSLSFDVRSHLLAGPRLREQVNASGRTYVLGMNARTADGTGWHNTALTLDASGTLGTHAKHHLVHFFNEGVPGSSFDPVKTSLGRIATPICFDNDFEDVPRLMTLAGAEFFAVPSMDVAQWSRRQHEQHAELVRIRASENARWFAVASSSGVTQIVSPKGQVTARLPTLTEGTLTGTVGREQALTFYTRWGWLFPWGVTGSLVIWLALGRFLRPRS